MQHFCHLTQISNTHRCFKNYSVLLPILTALTAPKVIEVEFQQRISFFLLTIKGIRMWLRVHTHKQTNTHTHTHKHTHTQTHHTHTHHTHTHKHTHTHTHKHTHTQTHTHTHTHTQYFIIYNCITFPPTDPFLTQVT